MIFRMRNFPLQDEMIISNAFPLIAKPICPQSIHKNNKHAIRLISGIICIPLLRQSLIPPNKPSFTSLYSPFNFIFLDCKIMKLPTGEKKKSPLLNWADNKSLPIQKHLTDNFPSNLHNSQSNITKKSNFPHARLKPWEHSGLNISM